MKRMSIAFTLLLAALAPLSAATYKIDPDHSTVGFKIRHLLSKVSGRFDRYQGVINYDPADSKAWKTQATIDAASINTNTPKRDEHLRSPDFFDVKTYPSITFVSQKVTGVKNKKAQLVGDLSIHGVTKSVALSLEINGVAMDPWGNERASFTGTTKIKRTDFGLNWNEAVETGGVLVGEDVEITLDVEAIRQKEEAAPAKK